MRKMKRSASVRWHPRLLLNGFSNPGRPQDGRGCTGSLLQRSMQRSIWRGRRGVVVSIPRGNDPRCPRHQHSRFCLVESARTTRTSIPANPPGPDTQLCVSGEIFAEYEEVIRRPRPNRSEAEVAAALRAIRETSSWGKPTEKVRACSDPDDDIFLECAQAAAAHYLVTGTAKDFPAAWFST